MWKIALQVAWTPEVGVFRAFPAVNFDKSIRIPSGELQKLIAHTAFAAIHRGKAARS